MNVRAHRVSVVGLTALFCLIASQASALTLFEDEETGRSLSLSGYVQPYYRIVHDICVPDRDDPTVCSALQTPDGFGLQRARIAISGAANDMASFKLEVRTVPDMQLLEAQINIHMPAGLTLNLGRFKVPFSRQEHTSESRLQLDRAQLIRHTPGRQLGASLHFDMPGNWSSLPEGFITAEVGMFNGESAKERSPINNIDDEFLYGGRFELNPFGELPDGEGDLRDPGEGRDILLGLGVNYAWRKVEKDRLTEDAMGADLAVMWNGLSLYGELFRRNRNYDGAQAGIDQYSAGFNVQVGYVLPVDIAGTRIEVVGRVEQFDPEIAGRAEDEAALVPTVPGGGPGSQVDLQGQRYYTGGLNWYFRGHDFKAQAIYTHRQATEDWASSAANADVPQDVDDDTFFLVATYRF